MRLLDRVPERESGEPLVDIREHAPSIRIMRPQTIPYARKKVVEMVERAAQLLPKGVILGVTDAWRPFQRQLRIYDWMTENARAAFPDRDPHALRRTVNRWVAPPYRKAPPGHCTGAAVDVMLVDEAGEALDVTSPYERFTAAPTYTLGLSPKALENRMMFVEAMLSVGFSNCRDEWWHYSYGDAGWAVRTGQPFCFYGLVELDSALYEEQERLSIEAMKDRPNPFMESA